MVYIGAIEVDTEYGRKLVFASNRKQLKNSNANPTKKNKNFRDLSRERESSEQFVWLNRRYGETETQLSRWAIMPSIRADSRQNEVI